MPACLIGLGSNLGDRRKQLDQAISQLERTSGVTIEAVSAWHETEPVGGPPGQGDFLNGAACIHSTLTPHQLLRAMQRIEKHLGRSATRRWQARPVDLDLLLYGTRIIHSSRLEVPHPWMAIRRFVLQPASEVAPAMVHPIIGWTIQRLLDHLRLSPPYVALCGVPGTGKAQVALRVSARVGGRMIRQPAPSPLGQRSDSAGHELETEIQFVRQRAELLDRGRWLAASRLAISDFWFGQSLAYARLRLSQSQQRRLEQVWEAESQSVQPHRLLVLLEAPRGQLEWVSRRAHGDMSCQQIERLQQALRREAFRPGQGPTLALSGQLTTRACDDLVAAIQAMG